MDRNEMRKEISEPVSAPGGCTTPMEQTVRQQVYEVTHLHQTIHRIARMLEVRPAREEAQ